MKPPFRMTCIVAAAAGLWLGSTACGDQLRNVKPGEPVPAFDLSTLDGTKLVNGDLEGKAAILVFLSAQQRSSEAALRSAHDVFQELRREDLTLLFVTADTAQTAFFRQQRDRLGVHEPLGLDFERRFYGSLGLIVLPTTIVVDREGRLAHVISSYKNDYEHVLRSYVQHALGQIDDEGLEEQLAYDGYQRDRPIDKIRRHRAAAQLLRESGLTRDAENELRAALEIDAEDRDTLLDLASLYLSLQQTADAETLVNGVLGSAPNHRRAKLLHGVVLYQLVRIDEAESVLTEALMLNPDPVQTHYYLGLIAEQRGDLAAANEHYRESLSRLLAKRPL